MFVLGWRLQILTWSKRREARRPASLWRNVSTVVVQWEYYGGERGLEARRLSVGPEDVPRDDRVDWVSEDRPETGREVVFDCLGLRGRASFELVLGSFKDVDEEDGTLSSEDTEMTDLLSEDEDISIISFTRRALRFLICLGKKSVTFLFGRVSTTALGMFTSWRRASNAYGDNAERKKELKIRK